MNIIAMRRLSVIFALALAVVTGCCSDNSFVKSNSQAAREYLIPVRPGYEGRNSWWNRFSPKFIYAPAFDVKEIEGAAQYRFTITDQGSGGLLASFTADTPAAPLSEVWNDIPVGTVHLSIDALDGQGAVLQHLFDRDFLRDFPFNGPYPGAPRSYSEAARRALLYVHRMSQVQKWLDSTEPDMSYFLYSYPAKIVSAVIDNECLLAELMPEYKTECETISRHCADFLISISQGPEAPLAFFPPTYYGDMAASGDPANKGKTMALEAVKAAQAFLNLYRMTGDDAYLHRALGITDTYARLQTPEGAFPIKLDFETGRAACPGLGVPDPVITLVQRLQQEFGIHDYDAMLDRCVKWIKDVALKSFDLTGQFEDTSVDVETHQNLTHWSAEPFAIYLLSKEDATADEIADAVDLTRFSEDQFVYWDALPASNGLKSICTPCAYEQYWNDDVKFKGSTEQFRYMTPIDCSSANIMLAFAKCYEATGDGLMLQKAKALGDNLVACQDVMGKIPTIQSPYLPDFWINCQCYTVKALLEVESIIEIAH